MFPITSFAAFLVPSVYDLGRVDYDFLVMHDTAGKKDKAVMGDANQAMIYSAASAHYLSNNPAPVSVHYLIGAEDARALDGNVPVFSIVPEGATAFHCGGNPPQFVSTFVDPATKAVWHGYDCNLRSLGIEVFGQPSDTLGPRQEAAVRQLVTSIVQRHPRLAEPGRIVTHKSMERDREDGPRSIAVAIDAAKKAVSAPIPPPVPVSMYFPQTAHSIGGGFLGYWQHNGGLPIFGYPLTEEMQENGQTVQYFERSRFEYHAAAPINQQVMLGRIGAELLALRQPAPVPPIPLVPPPVKP